MCSSWSSSNPTPSSGYSAVLATTSRCCHSPNHSMTQEYVFIATCDPSASTALTVPDSDNDSSWIALAGNTRSPVKPVSIQAVTIESSASASGLSRTSKRARPAESTSPIMRHSLQSAVLRGAQPASHALTYWGVPIGQRRSLDSAFCPSKSHQIPAQSRRIHRGVPVRACFAALARKTIRRFEQGLRGLAKSCARSDRR